MIGRTRFFIVFLLLAAAALYLYLHADIMVPMNRPFTEFPVTLDGWRMVSQERFSELVLEVLRPTDYLSRTYEDGSGHYVQLYIGYHGGGKGGGEIHSPKHCLPGNGWYEVSSRRERLAMGGGLNVVRAVYRKGGVEEVFYYWYQVRGRSYSDEYSLKFVQIINSILHRRRDAAFVRISAPVETDVKGTADFCKRFIMDFYAPIKQFLPA